MLRRGPFTNTSPKLSHLSIAFGCCKGDCKMVCYGTRRREPIAGHISLKFLPELQHFWQLSSGSALQKRPLVIPVNTFTCYNTDCTVLSHMGGEDRYFSQTIFLQIKQRKQGGFVQDNRGYVSFCCYDLPGNEHQ